MAANQHCSPMLFDVNHHCDNIDPHQQKIIHSLIASTKCLREYKSRRQNFKILTNLTPTKQATEEPQEDNLVSRELERWIDEDFMALLGLKYQMEQIGVHLLVKFNLTSLA